VQTHTRAHAQKEEASWLRYCFAQPKRLNTHFLQIVFKEPLLLTHYKERLFNEGLGNKPVSILTTS
jgi:hypothetical protein